MSANCLVSYIRNCSHFSKLETGLLCYICFSSCFWFLLGVFEIILIQNTGVNILKRTDNVGISSTFLTHQLPYPSRVLAAVTMQEGTCLSQHYEDAVSTLTPSSTFYFVFHCYVMMNLLMPSIVLLPKHTVAFTSSMPSRE
jgi:hypothetical protein